MLFRSLKHYHNQLLARKRLVAFEKWSTKLQDFFPLREHFRELQEKFNIDVFYRIDLSTLDKAAATIESKIKPLLKDLLPPFVFSSSDEIKSIEKELDLFEPFLKKLFYLF